MAYAIINNKGKTLPKRYATRERVILAMELLQKIHSKWFGMFKVTPACGEGRE